MKRGSYPSADEESSSELSGDDDESMQEDDRATSLLVGVQVLILLRQLLVKSREAPQISLEEKGTQTSSAVGTPSVSPETQQVVTQADLRKAVYNERTKGRLRAEILALRERCANLEEQLERVHSVPSTKHNS
jgi:hypothetical protein